MLRIVLVAATILGFILWAGSAFLSFSVSSSKYWICVTAGRVRIETILGVEDAPNSWSASISPTQPIRLDWLPVGSTEFSIIDPNVNYSAFPMWCLLVWAMILLLQDRISRSPGTGATLGRRRAMCVLFPIAVFIAGWVTAFLLCVPALSALLDTFAYPWFSPDHRLLIVGLIAFLPAFAMSRRFRTAKIQVLRELSHQCQKCGYLLLGVTERCPECGSPFVQAASQF